ncbi:MAG: glycosyltransferase, partial [Prevotella sp.]|nr:glycosyltransferase [Prevotella sp.]
MILKVSVTVPVYNTSSYLHQCLDSLQTQTLKEIEFILIDDGSTDNSGFICDEYAKRDSRFRVIHQKNGGSAVARQTGLDNAIGEYIIVCDSDDWVEPDMYEKLYRKAKDTDADIVCCGYFVEYKGGRSLPVQTIMKELDGVVDNDDLLRKGAGSSWVKLVKRSFFEKVNAFYESGINMGEDALIVYKLLRGNPKIVQIKGNLYHYRRLLSGNSYTNNVKMSHIFQLEFIYN